MLTLIYVLCGLAGVTLLAWLALLLWILMVMRNSILKESADEHE